MKDNPVTNGDSYVPQGLVKLGTFEWPRSETRQTLGHLFEKIKGGLLASARTEGVNEQDLKHVSNDELKSRVAELLTDNLIQMLDAAYLDWMQTQDGSLLKRVFVYPPTCDNLLADWAEIHGLTIVRSGEAFDGLSRDTGIVIPNLEAFFRRDYGQLSNLFDLFGKLADHKGRVLVGCNSWAWKFLKQFDDAHLLFDEQQTVPAFDANALASIMQRAWTSTGNQKSIKSIESGEPVLSRDDDGDLEDLYFETLAGRSLGHPWVAIEMLFRGIAEIDEDDASADTTWVDLPKPCSLPDTGSESLLFALQALMIHGPREVEDLSELLPASRLPNGVWTELARVGFVAIDNGVVRCVRCSYPDIRSELGAAGFNVDEL